MPKMEQRTIASGTLDFQKLQFGFPVDSPFKMDIGILASYLWHYACVVYYKSCSGM